MKTIFLTVILVAFLGCGAETELSNADRLAIKQLEETYVKGWFSNDPKAEVLAAFEEGAAFMPNQGAQPIVGIDSLEAFFWPEGYNGFVNDFNHYPDTVEGNSSIAWVRGQFNLKYSWVTNKDTSAAYNEGTYLLVARKQPDNEWKIASFIFSAPPAINVD